MNVNNSNILRDTCENVQIFRRDMPTNVSCVETYKLEPTYEVGTVNRDCSNVF
jgi:hypothetical protein